MGRSCPESQHGELTHSPWHVMVQANAGLHGIQIGAANAGRGSDLGNDADDHLQSIPEEKAEQDSRPATTQVQGSRSHSAMVPKAALPHDIDKDQDALLREISLSSNEPCPASYQLCDGVGTSAIVVLSLSLLLDVCNG